MNLYLISQNKNNGYDTYDSAVVCAETKEKARMIHPYRKNKWDGTEETHIGEWCSAKHVKAKLIGKAHPEIEMGSVICASFNAG